LTKSMFKELEKNTYSDVEKHNM